MKEYAETVSLVERLHRRLLDVLRIELDRLGIGDINNVQSLMLFNMGEKEISVGELTSRGYYLGSNVTYNLKKMIDRGYVVEQRSSRDRRVVQVRLSDKGLAFYEKFRSVLDRHHSLLAARQDEVPLESLTETLRELERFWSERFDALSRGE